uniref:Uncharacterized protein n=1 Tax=Globodera rostochiensis TaxID=31243 RepID=A0A914I1D2_GLORO
MIIENSLFDDLPRRDGSQSDFNVMCQLLRGLGYQCRVCGYDTWRVRFTVRHRRPYSKPSQVRGKAQFAKLPKFEWQTENVHYSSVPGASTRRDSLPQRRDGSCQRPVLRETINKDYLIALSTAPNYLSLRNLTLGTRFIQSLAAVFAEHAADDDILRLMIRVNAMGGGDRFSAHTSETHNSVPVHFSAISAGTLQCHQCRYTSVPSVPVHFSAISAGTLQCHQCRYTSVPSVPVHFSAISAGTHQCHQCRAVCVVMTHGEYDLLYGTDGRTVNLHKFVARLNSRNCPNLNGKPKMFIIQACRRHDRPGASTRRDSLPQRRDGSCQRPVLRETINKDYLIALSTAPNYLSLRNLTLGTRFIQSLAAVFAEHAADDDILRLMIRVNAMGGGDRFSAHTSETHNSVPVHFSAISAGTLQCHQCRYTSVPSVPVHFSAISAGTLQCHQCRYTSVPSVPVHFSASIFF